MLEVTGSNVVSVAEHVVMNILLLVRNFVPAHEMIERGEWQVSDVARNAFDLEGKVIGTLGAGRIGYRVLERLQPFNPKELLYYDYNPLPAGMSILTGLVCCVLIRMTRAYRRCFEGWCAARGGSEGFRVPGMPLIAPLRASFCISEFPTQCDIITINAPLHEGTKGLIDAELLKHFKKGAWIVNTARGAICNTEDVAAALKSGQLNGYAGDVWNVQPAPKDHPWRYMKNPLGGGNGMVPHYSGTTLDAQARYAQGTRQILENYFEGKAQEPANVIVGVGMWFRLVCVC